MQRLRLEDITDNVSKYIHNPNIDVIHRAYVFSAKVHKGQLRCSGEPYLTHPLGVSYILSNLKMDEITVAVGLLHDTVEDTLASLEEIRKLFGNEIASLVDGITKISQIYFKTQEEKQAENYRKLILAMADDLRVIIVKLADRLHNMRTLEFLSHEKQKRIAQETMDIYAPFANRLGMAKIKSELEDLAFKYLEPEFYAELQEKIQKSYKRHAKIIDQSIAIIKRECKKMSIPCEVYGRKKHFYSIHQKMLRKNLSFNQILDHHGVRIITKSVKNCYEAIGVIHSLWKPVSGGFDDYIAVPKPNMYQSLHTVVIGPKSQCLEVQIRTEQMHIIAEEGIAAHWLYKEDKKIDKKYSNKLRWLRQSMEWLKDLKDPKEFLRMFKMDLFHDEVFVFTPKGQVKAFPIDATAIDFAYSIHTEVGNRCCGVRVNGRIEPLKYKLKTGDIVEIITSPKQKPNRDWLKFVKTTKAIQRIKHWLKIEEKSRSLALGKEILDKEAKKYNLSYNKIFHQGDLLLSAAKKLNIKTTDDLITSIGYGKVTAKQVLSLILPSDTTPPIPKTKKAPKMEKEGVKIQGLDDVIVRFARCCNPIPGDEIVGFISRQRGISIHRVTCSNAKSLTLGTDKQIDVEWDIKNDQKQFPVDISITSEDKMGLLAQITTTISQHEANILSADVKTTNYQTAIIRFKIMTDDVNHLNKLLNSIKKHRGVISVERIT
ncbi:MAG: RelA/SpoT family protein [bacterium]